MDKKTLTQYRALLKEQEMNDRAIDKLYDRAADVPTVLGKVTGSSKNFPFIEVRTTVQMDEPKEAEEIARRLRIRKARQAQIRKAILEIEQFISKIPDSIDRQIFELTYIEGKKQREVAEEVGYSRSRISQIINEFLKD
ncbi:MAG: sigma-70 family RNA polymerase sigma factor [Faecalicatena sp.]|uniref:sigma factor-like helix-turn-helix DNA-binding protein n=1 Tax=Faecalicatena sp. TaxID=2005360 RepID=UPI00258FE53B|nr:sigma factor-like helix-turn-helix DNA-binding protein [Faecalicatena sp.]MCI6468137.1 sigma-70 family RNA polymerase sigma factor [Faecalicatena sp.]MDY5620391.1 sigma factor-like helix-turn-helix DNA-binding protein [Lachnospiraceae bacterium]